MPSCSGTRAPDHDDVAERFPKDNVERRVDLKAARYYTRQ
jgi:hypothetical protein